MSAVGTPPAAQSPFQRRFNNLSPSSTRVPHTPERFRTLISASTTPSGSPIAAGILPAGFNVPTPLYRFTDGIGDTVLSLSQSQTPLAVEAALPASGLYANLETTTHTDRLALQAEMTHGKGTDIAYPRQVDAYRNFWETDQLSRCENPGDEMIPSFPITPTKVAWYLKYATTRPKRARDGTEIEGTTLGWESIKQIVSALESHRKNHQHEEIYRACSESHIPLRNDIRIQVYEKASKVTDAQKRATSENTKAHGAMSDTYTDDELIRGSMWFIRSSGKTKLQVHTGVRDRAMLLVSTTTAYRGDNTRRIAWSDLKLKQVILVDVGPDAKEYALVFISNQGKTNTTGRIDEQAALRHRIPELCSLGAISFYFFSHFHILKKALPDFSPEYNGANDNLGTRSWYDILLFPGAESDTSEMSYENHRRRVNTMKVKNNIEINKVTHAGRPYAAITAREHRASRDDTKDLGGWSQGGSFGVYDQTLPIDAMVAAASFNARKQETYLIARAEIDPPQELLSSIFPWLEEEEAARQARRETNGKKADDVALKNFLEFLMFARCIVLQDAAVLLVKYPDCAFFTFPPFNGPTFQSWALSTGNIIQAAEERSRVQLQAFPPHAVASMRGILDETNLRHEQAILGAQSQHVELQSKLETVDSKLHTMQELIQTAAFPRSRRRRLQTPSSSAITPMTTPPVTTTPSRNTTPIVPLTHTSASPAPSLVLTNPSLPYSSPVTSTISRSGNIYPPGLFVLSNDPFERDQQLASLEKLEQKFPMERLLRHQFEWKVSHHEWLPFYQWWKPSSSMYPTVEQIWTENAHGMDGQLSIRELTAGWEARWKRNESRIKSECSRRGKIIGLIEDLAKKPNWTTTLTLRFLKERYPIPTLTIPHLRTTRAFIDKLQKSDGELRSQILEAADNYQSSSSNIAII